jgi:hypothetical protein
VGNVIDLTGMVFGYLVVIGRVANLSAANRNSRWLCRCECGHPGCRGEIIVISQHLRGGHTVSCGSERTKKHALTHGYSMDPDITYRSWLNMRNRCNNPKATDYRHYGGRGITVCERWNSYENFLADMGPKPAKGYELDRINPDGNYEPTNCRWIKRGRGLRRCTYKVMLEGQTLTLRGACRKLGLNYLRMQRLMSREGLTFTEALKQIHERLSQVVTQ